MYYAPRNSVPVIPLNFLHRRSKMHPDVSYANFLKIHTTYSNNAVNYNEADTRSKIIDFILRDCLDWDEQYISRENKNVAGYTDYELNINGHPILIIEAKKTDEYFTIPEANTNRTYKISGIVSTIPNLVKAINQVQAYCVELGCKYASVFNGHQLVVFSAITIGKPWRDGYCTVFYSLDDIKNNFSQFWNLLSYSSIHNGSLVDHLDKGIRKKSFKKILNEIHNPDQSWARNELYTFIQPYCDFVFSELLDERKTEILKECYVYDRSSKPLTDEIQSFFKDKLPHFATTFNITDFVEQEKNAGKFQKEFAKNTYGNSSGSMMVLLGGIGSGKSTFLHRFFKVVISEKENYLWFYVDFRDSSINCQEIEGYIFRKIYEIWCAKYKKKYSEVLDKISFSADETNIKEYLKKIFNLSDVLKFSTTVVIDNIDQHRTDFQEQIFLASSHIKDTLKTLTILALREETFINSTRTGALDAYYIQKFHISSPNFLNMIIKRIDFTIRILKSSTEALPKDDLLKYLGILKESLGRNNKQSTQIVMFIDSVSVGNMREALKMFNNFVVSGNTNIKDIFLKHEQSGNYQLSYHQFIKSIMLGEHKYYSQDRSQIMNLFDYDSSITDSPFNLLRILEYLLTVANKRSEIGRGYVKIDDVISVFDEISISRPIVIDSLLRLSSFNLVEYDNQSRTDIASASYAKLTAAGNYYLNNLVFEFVYLESIIADSPISDQKLFDGIKKEINSTELAKRIDRTGKFIEYLVDCETNEYQRLPEYSVNSLTETKYASLLQAKYKNFVHKINRITSRLGSA